MKLIGITGGVGAGKSQVLSCLASRCRCRILLADEVGNEVKLPGSPAMNGWWSCWERMCWRRTGPLTGDGWLKRFLLMIASFPR